MARRTAAAFVIALSSVGLAMGLALGQWGDQGRELLSKPAAGFGLEAAEAHNLQVAPLRSSLITRA